MRVRRVLAATGVTLALLAPAFVTHSQESPVATPEFSPVWWNTVRKDNGNGTKTWKISAGWENYYEDGQWKEIDTKPVSVGNGWVINKAPYSLLVPDYADDAVTFASTTAYDVDTRSFRGDKPVSKTKRFTGVSHVRGEYEGDAIVYKDAHPLGDLMYKPLKNGFQAIVRLNQIPPQCVSNPSGSVQVPFTEDYSDSMSPRSGGASVNATQRDIGKGWRTDYGEARKLVTQPAEVWDITGKRQFITVNGRVVAGQLRAAKVLPCDFLLAAQYPVFTDTLTTVQAASTDGEVEHTSGSAWATVRGATQGTLARTNSSPEAFLSWTGGSGDYYSILLFFIFDTSSIPDSETVTAATFSVHYSSATTSAMTMYLVRNRQSSDTLSIVHYDEIGDSGPGNGTVFGSYARGAGEAAGTETITMNASGIAQISKTGNTYYTLVDSDHWDNSTPTKTNTTGASADMSEAGGTSNDPTLTITSSVASGGQSFVLF